MCRPNGTASSEWCDELHMDRWLIIGIESSHTSIKHNDDLYRNRHQRWLYRHSSIYSNSQCNAKYKRDFTSDMLRSNGTASSKWHINEL